jgi:hypothetical protein
LRKVCRSRLTLNFLALMGWNLKRKLVKAEMGRNQEQGRKLITLNQALRGGSSSVEAHPRARR